MTGDDHGPDFPQPRSILIVDDNLITAKAIESLLCRHHRVVAFDRASAMLEHAKKYGCLAAIVDVHLPDLNGLVAAQQLRDIVGPEVLIIILSGDTSMETLNALPQAGATHFFSKPVASSTLLDKINESLRASKVR